MIDLSTLPRIGNMSRGGGLDAAFDGNQLSQAWNEATTGWVGVDLGTPRRIDRAAVSCQSLGFDASGLTTGITLTLRGKNGTVPTSAVDGTVIGSLSFTDINAVQTRTITSTDKVTAWQYVWVTVSTGVWAVVSEIALFEAPEPAPPLPLPDADEVVLIRSVNAYAPLPWNAAPIPGFDMSFQVAADSVALIDFQANAKHQGNELSPAYWGVVGVGFVVQHRAPGADWVTIPNGTSGFNISERNPQHYGAAVITGAVSLAPGFHAFRVLGTAHTDADSRDNIARLLVEGGQGLNAFRITVKRGAALVRL